MDLNDYISSINKDLQKELDYLNRQQDDFLNNILGKSSSAREATDFIRETPAIEPTEKSGGIKTIARLKVDSRLEESSKSKIGTFERVYNDIFLEKTRIPIETYGYSDLEYAPLVTLLSTIMETELNHSAYQAIRQKHGIDISTNFNKNRKGPWISIGKESINIGAATQMLGSLKMLIEREKSYISSYLKDVDGFCQLLDALRETRNDASHGKYINKERFIDFYTTFAELYNRHIFSLLDLKERLKDSSVIRPYSSDKTFSESIYSSYSIEEEKEDEDYVRSLFEACPILADRLCSNGIIMTDCRKLSEKYYGDIRYLKERIYDRFEQIIKAYEEVGITYRLLDIDDRYASILEEYPGWMGYHKALDDYCAKNGITENEPTGLFIIGGDDVIPMPKIENPAAEAYTSESQEMTIDSDVLYAFSSDYIKISHTDRLSRNIFLQNLGKPRFYVGRLPLESGMMNTLFETDIIRYFARAIDAHREGGIKISAPTFATCHSAKECGRQMTKDIPLMEIKPEKDRFVSNMIISPLAMLEYEKMRALDSEVIREITNDPSELNNYNKEYLDEISKADMLIFLLHGGYRPTYPQYKGEAYSCETRDCFQSALFEPDLLTQDNINVKSIATVSCYGARFINYSRGDSMLLTSIHNDTLLFYGSSRTAYGSFDVNLPIFNGQNQYSLIQMRSYLFNLLSGVQAGIAIQNARTEYLKHHIKAREINAPYEFKPNIFLTTLLEFNLFGDPLLNIQKIMDVPDTKDNWLNELADFTYDSRNDRTYTEVYSAKKKDERSILDRVRMLVDRNFESIHNKIKENLYSQYRINPRNLYCAKAFTDGYGRKGYTITYKDPDPSIESYKIIDTDHDGNITSLIETI